ncbi:MAG: DUF222 domain-containing protein [Streptosporangiaceae bacterium]
MSIAAIPAGGGEALAKLLFSAGYLADLDAAQLPAEVLGQCIRELVQADAVITAALAPMLAAFDAKDGHQADGQKSLRTWLVHMARVTRGQAAQYLAIRALPRDHQPLLAGLRTRALTTSEALQLAKWTRAIPAEFRGQAEEILVAAARAGADLRALAQICAEILSRTVPPDPDGNDPALDRAVFLDTTLDGAGLIRGDLTPECAAMVQAVLDALSAPAGAGDLRTRPQRYHDALAEAMKRLLASGLLPRRAGQPVKALVHVSFADLCDLDVDSKLQETWIAEYRARWAAQRAAASVSTGDGGAWLEGDAARRVACDAMLVPVVTCDIDLGAVDVLVGLCVQYDHLRRQASDGPDSGGRMDDDGPDTRDAADTDDAVDTDGGAGTLGVGTRGGAVVPTGSGHRPAAPAGQASRTAQVLAMLEHQILATVLQIVSGPGGVASFLRRNLLGQGLNGPSLPLDVGQTDDIPVHLRRLVALRDQRCQFPGGCDQPASGCEPHHVVHGADGGHTSLVNLKDYCHWHHHVVLHQMGWQLTVHPDGTSQVKSPGGKIIRSHSPPPAPG